MVDRASSPAIPLSVIMPSYNEGDGLMLALDEVRDEVLRAVPGAEVIVVDDGSTDATESLLQAKALQMPSLRVIRQKNAGHGAALRNGIEAARGDVLLLLDSDRQIALAQFGEHWRKLHDLPLDAILGIRTPRHDPPVRLVITRVMRAGIALRFGKSPRDAGVPYKLLRRVVWDDLAPRIRQGSVVPSVLLAILLLNTRGERIVECNVVHRARVTGRSVLRWGRLYRLCRDGAADILSLPR